MNGQCLSDTGPTTEPSIGRHSFMSKVSAQFFVMDQETSLILKQLQHLVSSSLNQLLLLAAPAQLLDPETP